MRKVLRKVKSHWAVLGIMGATVIALGAADVPQISADEIEGATTSESVAGSESGAGSEVLEASENAVQPNSQESEDSTNAVTQAVISDFAESQTPSEVSEEVPAAEEVDYATIVSTTDVAYPAVISRDTDAINTAPWGMQGYQTIGSSAYYVGRTVDVIKEQVTDYGVTWALVSMNGKELGWIAKDALTAQTYAAIVSETAVEYPATISRDTDAINTSPWGIRGYQTIASSADFAGKAVEVTKEQVTDYGVTWALVSLDGKELGWIAKDALTTQTYAAIVSETAVEYPAVISRDTDAINTAPWGTKGYQTISTSAAFDGQTVGVTKEQITDYGVTWAQISLNGEILGWIAKDALTAQTYAQVTKETAVAYSAAINRDSDAINTAPWGTKGYQTLATSAAYVGQTVEVTKEQETDYGVTWAQVSLNGEVLGWIARDALKVQTYAQITEETTVDYSATISRATDAINTAPWGTKGYQTLASSADYSGQTVEVTKEQVTDYGVTWAQISLNGEVLGWIAKDALTVQTYSKIVKETAVDYQATISRATDAINTAPWGTKGYQTVGSSADYLGKTVKVSKEQITDYGVTWVLVSLNGKELGWVAKACLNEQTDEVVVDGETYEEITMAPDSEYTFIGEEVTNVIPAVTNEVVIPAVILHVEAVYATIQVPVLDAEGNETGEFTEEKQLVSEAYDEVIEPERIETVITPEVVVQQRVDQLNIQTPYEIIIRYVGTLPEGTRYVETKGDYGMIVVPITVTTENGIQVSSVRGEEWFVIAPTTEVVVVGTQKVVTVVTNIFEETTTVPYKIVTVEDDSLMVGETALDQVGQEGIVVKTYTQKTTDGVIGEKVQVGNAVETESVNQIVRVGTKEVKQEARETAISFGTVYQNDESAYTDSSVVTTEGQNGTKVTTYEVTYVKGQKVSETAVAEEVTVAPVNKVITVGTKAIETTGTVTEIEDIAYQTITKYDNTLVEGTEVVETQGQTGTKEISYTVTYNNGEEFSRTVASEVVTKAPVNKVVVIGAQHIEVKQETNASPIAFETLTVTDDTKDKNYSEVTTEGQNGVVERTYDITYINGERASSELASEKVLQAPINKVITVGARLTEVKSETTTENEVGYATVEEEDNTIPTGERVIVQAGVDGYDTVTYDVTYVNGIETNRVEVSRMTTAPVNEITIKGTQPTNDITKPVIDAASVKVSSNTATLGDSVIISVAVSDDKDVSSVNVSLKTSFRQPNGAATFETVELHKNNTTGLFEGALNVTDSTALGPWQFATIEATDTSGNAVRLYSTSVYDYWGPSLLLVPHADLSYANIMVTAEVPDNTEPVIGAVKVSSDTVTSGESVTVSVLVSDDRGIPFSTEAAPMEWSGVEAYYISPITNNYESVSLYENSITGLFEGTLNITNASEAGTWRLYRITAYDTSGNRSDLYNSNAAKYYESPAIDLSSADFTVVDDIIGIIEEEEPVYVDEENPQAQLVLSTSAPTTGPINVTVVATDNVGVASITLPDGTVVNGDVANFVVSKNDYYYVTLTDVNGNVAYQGVEITNIQAPVLDGELPELSYEVSTTEPDVDAVDVTVRATDNGEVAYIIAEDGSTIIDGSEYHFTSTKPGTYTIQAVDKSGNVGFVNVDIYNVKFVPVKTEDKTAPIILFTPSRTINAAEQLVLRVTIVEDGGIATFVSHDGMTTYGWGPSEYTFYQNGTYTFKVTDKSGNEAVATYEVTQIDGFVDKVGPKITYTVSNPNPTQEQSITVYVSIPDSDFDYAVAPDGTIITSNEFSFDVTRNGFSDLVAYDKSGNVSRLSIPTFNIDRHAPETYALEESRTADSVTYRLIVMDDVGIVSITLPDGTTENMSANVDSDFMEMMTFTKNGTYTLTAVDYFGRVSTSTFVVDSLPQ